MGRIWESINASNQHMPTHVPIDQTAGSPQCHQVHIAWSDGHNQWIWHLLVKTMSGNINNIPVAYQWLMYQHFIAIQQFFLPIDFFFCHLQHTNMLPGKGSAHKFLPHTLRYFISMDSYFDKQLHLVFTKGMPTCVGFQGGYRWVWVQVGIYVPVA